MSFSPVSRSDLFRLVLISAITIVFACFAWQSSMAADDPVTTYQENRKAFVEKQKQAREMFNQNTGDLDRQLKQMRQELEEQQEKLDEIHGLIGSYESQARSAEAVQSAFGSILFPEAFAILILNVINSSLFEWMENLIYFGFALCILNVGVFMIVTGKSWPKRRKVAVIVAMALLISVIASPLFASDLENREELITKLELVGKVLSQSDHERYIAILESKPSNLIRVPDLASGDEHFSVYREVYTDRPEYWYTLAALYTHEGMKGRTLEAVKKMIEEGDWSGSEEHQKMILDCIGYLLQEQQTELVTEAVESLIPAIGSPTVLLKLATLLEENGMRSSAEKVLGQAINKASSVEELIELSQYLIGKSELEKGNRALDRAWQKVSSVDELLLVLQTAIKAGRDELVATIAGEMGGANFGLDDRLSVVDLLLENGRREEAITVFSRMIEDVSKHSNNKKDHLLYLIDTALKRSLLPQATNATNLLYLMLSIGGDDMTFQMQAGSRLDAARGLPDEDLIMLPQFYGLINEEQGIYDEAEAAYIADVMINLEKILSSYGYELPDTMNSFFLLGRTWVRESRGDLLQRLDNVYSIIETQFINEQKRIEEHQLQAKREEIESVRQQIGDLEQSSGKALIELAVAKRKMVLQFLSTIASVLFVIAVTVGCIFLSWIYSKTLQICKTFGFTTKFFELMGWLRVFSALGVLSGLAAIFTAQFFQLIQQNQENTRKFVQTDYRKRNIQPVQVAAGVVDEPTVTSEAS